MCGRAQVLKIPEIIEAYGPARVGDIVDATLADEAFPKSVVPGLVLHNGERVVSAFAWAFFDDGTGHNARLETAADRPAWRDAYRHTRLILPLARFVEGRAWFSDSAGRPLAVAGLYRLCRPPGGQVNVSGARPTGGPVRRAVMLTRPADDTVAPFHERMPVILPPDTLGPWLEGGPVPLDRLLTESPGLAVEPLRRPGPPPPQQPSLL
ncbi:MAG TPA: SOS response-associated peptidase family protein [Acidimicrobiia bacterium]|nr:SOS response-associated peptidase family protein [Acidimicrobiia bacterium]